MTFEHKRAKHISQRLRELTDEQRTVLGDTCREAADLLEVAASETEPFDHEDRQVITSQCEKWLALLSCMRRMSPVDRYREIEKLAEYLRDSNVAVPLRSSPFRDEIGLAKLIFDRAFGARA